MMDDLMTREEMDARLANLRAYLISADHGTGAFADDIRAVEQMRRSIEALEKERDGLKEMLGERLMTLDEAGNVHQIACEHCSSLKREVLEAIEPVDSVSEVPYFTRGNGPLNAEGRRDND